MGKHATAAWEPDLTEERRKAVAGVYALAARRSAENDPIVFEEACALIAEIYPEYVPSQPAHLALASRLFGYRRAERLAVLYRRTMRRLGRRSS